VFVGALVQKAFADVTLHLLRFVASDWVNADAVLPCTLEIFRFESVGVQDLRQGVVVLQFFVVLWSAVFARQFESAT
jgi:hypothetical protein